MVLTVFGLIALVLASVTGSTPLALVVIALAVAGIVQLVRDWRREPAAEPTEEAEAATTKLFIPKAPAKPELSVDDFAPDISPDPDGPSSDARADQH